MNFGSKSGGTIQRTKNVAHTIQARLIDFVGIVIFIYIMIRGVHNPNKNRTSLFSPETLDLGVSDRNKKNLFDFFLGSDVALGAAGRVQTPAPRFQVMETLSAL